MAEQRRVPRVAFHHPATFTVPGSAEPHACHFRDISQAGAFLETDDAATFGAEVTVSLVPPGESAPVALKGIVRWTAPEGMGLQFGLLGARETHAIAEIVRRSSTA